MTTQPTGAAELPEALSRYREYMHLRTTGAWSDGVPAWAKDYSGRMNDMTAAHAVIEELHAQVEALRAQAAPAAVAVPSDVAAYLNVADQCAETATSELARQVLVDGGSGLLRELLNNAADAIRWSVALAAAPQPTAAAPAAQGDALDAAHLEAAPAGDAMREALLIARDHIDMEALRISHCKDAAAIDAALAAQKGGRDD